MASIHVKIIISWNIYCMDSPIASANSTLYVYFYDMSKGRANLRTICRDHFVYIFEIRISFVMKGDIPWQVNYCFLLFGFSLPLYFHGILYFTLQKQDFPSRIWLAVGRISSYRKFIMKRQGMLANETQRNLVQSFCARSFLLLLKGCWILVELMF